MTMVLQESSVRRYELTDATQCAEWIQRLKNLQPHWTQRGPAFYTLGAAAYLDLCSKTGSRARYDEVARRGNPIIEQTFGDMLKRVSVCIEDYVEGPCEWARHWARPGFHVFRTDSLKASLRDNFHLDLQFMHLSDNPDLLARSVTFTLPLQLPDQGAGLEICRIVPGKPAGEIVQERYQLGELLVHTGRALHRRAHYPVSSQCERITMQGHGLKEGARWLLYW
jgi:hypothetical protein